MPRAVPTSSATTHSPDFPLANPLQSSLTDYWGAPAHSRAPSPTRARTRSPPTEPERLVTGLTTSINFPVKNAAFPWSANHYDALVTKLAPSGALV